VQFLWTANVSRKKTKTNNQKQEKKKTNGQKQKKKLSTSFSVLDELSK
jgi:hypothetical protein